MCFLELTACNTDTGRASFKQLKTLNDFFNLLSPCVRFEVYTLECVRYSVSEKVLSLPGILQGLNFVNTSQKNNVLITIDSNSIVLIHLKLDSRSAVIFNRFLFEFRENYG